MAALATIAATVTVDIRESLATADLSRQDPRTGRQPPRQPAPVAEAPAPTTPPQLSACQQRLTPDFVLMHPLAPITGPGSCGAEDVVRLDAVVAPQPSPAQTYPPRTAETLGPRPAEAHLASPAARNTSAETAK